LGAVVVSHSTVLCRKDFVLFRDIIVSVLLIYVTFDNGMFAQFSLAPCFCRREMKAAEVVPTESAF
jgi:hypothetical protein